MTGGAECFLRALRCALRKEPAAWAEPVSDEVWRELLRLAREHSVLPLLAQATYDGGSLPEARRRTLVSQARQLTVYQARLTAEFLLLYEYLAEQGLRPLVMKGIVCRNLYPYPEQRSSVDEDLLIRPEELDTYHRVLTEYGLVRVEPFDADEVSYRDDGRGLYIEVHTAPFPASSKAYGDCTLLFDGVMDRSVDITIYGVSIRTLAPTDHLLYLICHAYKHFLYSGVGIRQVCDIAMFTEAYRGGIDWGRVRENCESIRVDRFAAALFGIDAKHLGFAVPEVFRGIEVYESDLLEDILSGGLYGTNSLDRAHSSTLTLDAVASDRSGKRRGGVLRSVFLPAAKLRGRFPYLRRYPVLLPVAWGQRIWGYLSRRNGTAIHPARSIEIGKRRIDLLKEYGIID